MRGIRGGLGFCFDRWMSGGGTRWWALNGRVEGSEETAAMTVAMAMAWRREWREGWV